LDRWEELAQEELEFDIVDEVVKHLPGQHDQSQHGRGSSATKVPANQFRSALDKVKAEGGLSVKMIDGSVPTEGFMVALGGDSGAIVPAEDFFNPEKGQKAVADFLKQNKEKFADNRVFLGLWHNKNDGNVYLDVSENILDRARATAAGRERDQISIWDVSNVDEIPTGGTGSVG